ncbi:MAG TPA: NAD-dependent epimerase/dehydratase family protein, partial [Blastocatellia bacterium]|nr:NAD-dependent epimerase/dehydratase family protein [Blastocatellia bacterium]
MRILIIGGTGFIGPSVARQLAAGGHEVIVMHRGRSATSLPGGVKVMRGDRQALNFMAGDFKRLAPDVVIDLICYNEAEAAE